MESISPEEARAALDSSNATRGKLADRMRAPWWHHPLLGLLMGQFVAVAGLDEITDRYGWARQVSMLVLAVGVFLLVRGYLRAVGVWSTTKAVGSLTSRKWLAAIFAAVVGLTLVSVGFDRPLVAVLSGVGVLVAMAILGPKYDAACRHDLRVGSEQ